MASTKDGVPPISKWHTFAGGTMAAPGKYSYQFNTARGEYHIWPVSSQRGRHLGYGLKFAATKQQPKGRGGLWHDLGMHKTPASAAVAARVHDTTAF